MKGEQTIIKSVFCNYRGRVTVYDINGQKVHELSGQLNYASFIGIQDLVDPDITEFDGKEHFDRIGQELLEENNVLEPARVLPPFQAKQYYFPPKSPPLINPLPRFINPLPTVQGPKPISQSPESIKEALTKGSMWQRILKGLSK